MYNFDKVIDRSGSDDLKHGALLPRWGRDDLLPLWVDRKSVGRERV